MITPARIRAATIAVAAAALATLGLSTAALGASSSTAAPTRAQAQAAQVLSNIAYAPAQPAGSQGHLLDLYLPSGFSGARPLVIWTSGSAWMSDTGKSGDDSIAAMFNPLGFAVAGVSVRSSSQATFPAQVYDIKAAIRWLRANAAQYQLDPSRFAVMGDSSGGWETNMATLTGGVSTLEGSIGTTGVSSSVQAGVSLFGPTDFLKMNSERIAGGLDHDAANSPESLLMGCAIQTCPTQVQQADPITYLTSNEPPMLLLHGQNDPLVPNGQSLDLYNALAAKCDSVQFISVPGAGHSDSDVLSPSHYGSQTVKTNQGCQQTTTVGSPNPSWNLIEAFLQSALQVGGGSPSPSSSASASPSPSTSASPSTSPSSGASSCRIAYSANSWSTGFTASVTVTNTGASALNGWTLSWTWPGNQQVTSAWNATVSQSGTRVTAVNLSYNATIAPGANTNFGFQATYSGTNTAPTQFTLNGSACSTG